MKYEICKVRTEDGIDLHMPIAWTDVLAFAKKIVWSLEITSSEKFAVCIMGEPVDEEKVMQEELGNED